MDKQAYEDGVELVGNPAPVGGYFGDIGETEGIELAYEELMGYDEINREYNEEMTPPAETEWKSTGWNYDYDDSYIYIEEEDFINISDTNMKKIGIKLKYDDKPVYADKNYVNRSQTNWEIINRG